MKKYWFLYDLTSGEIKASQKVETDDWTNIPEGCGVLGFGDDTTAVVLDAYENRNLYVVQNGELMPPGDVDSRRLEAAKETKRRELRRARDAAIKAGFTSATTGMTYFYEETDQSKMRGQAALLALRPEIVAVDWLTQTGPYNHTREEFITVCEEAGTHERTQHEAESYLLAQVDAAAKVEDVETVSW